MFSPTVLRKFSLITASSVLLAFGGIKTAQAASFTIFNSGVDNAGSVLPDGTVDSHYTIPTSVNGPSNAFAVAAYRAYVPNNSTSKWIGPTSNAGNSNISVGNFTYRTTFNLTGLDPNTAVLKGNFASDNNTVSVLINGNSTGITSSFTSFTSFSPFSITSGFVNGVNTIDFVVFNGGFSSGLRTEFTQGTAAPAGSTVVPNAVVPEPSEVLGTLVFGTLAAGYLANYRTLP